MTIGYEPDNNLHMDAQPKVNVDNLKRFCDVLWRLVTLIFYVPLLEVVSLLKHRTISKILNGQNVHFYSNKTNHTKKEINEHKSFLYLNKVFKTSHKNKNDSNINHFPVTHIFIVYLRETLSQIIKILMKNEKRWNRIWTWLRWKSLWIPLSIEEYYEDFFMDGWSLIREFYYLMCFF